MRKLLLPAICVLMFAACNNKSSQNAKGAFVNSSRVTDGVKTDDTFSFNGITVVSSEDAEETGTARFAPPVYSKVPGIQRKDSKAR